MDWTGSLTLIMSTGWGQDWVLKDSALLDQLPAYSSRAAVCYRCIRPVLFMIKAGNQLLSLNASGLANNWRYVSPRIEPSKALAMKVGA